MLRGSGPGVSPAPARAAAVDATMRANGDCAVEKVPGGCIVRPAGTAAEPARDIESAPRGEEPPAGDPRPLPCRGNSTFSETVSRPAAPVATRCVSEGISAAPEECAEGGAVADARRADPMGCASGDRDDPGDPAARAGDGDRASLLASPGWSAPLG